MKALIDKGSTRFWDLIRNKSHVHLLLSLDPRFGVHRAVKRLKGATSRYLRLEFPHLKQRFPSLWTNSYFVSTVRGAPLAKIKEYIQAQKRSETIVRKFYSRPLPHD
ncbi:MAG: IS200/IS605 family transposase [Xenococcus sp. MO_188.B8]|nr:IS200/IS605 family transposase [Xenococcus sp. MO_188.B8]